MAVALSWVTSDVDCVGMLVCWAVEAAITGLLCTTQVTRNSICVDGAKIAVSSNLTTADVMGTRGVRTALATEDGKSACKYVRTDGFETDGYVTDREKPSFWPN